MRIMLTSFMAFGVLGIATYLLARLQEFSSATTRPPAGPGSDDPDRPSPDSSAAALIGHRPYRAFRPQKRKPLFKRAAFFCAARAKKTRRRSRPALPAPVPGNDPGHRDEVVARPIGPPASATRGPRHARKARRHTRKARPSSLTCSVTSPHAARASPWKAWRSDPAPARATAGVRRRMAAQESAHHVAPGTDPLRCQCRGRQRSLRNTVSLEP